MERNRGGRPRHADILTPAEWRILEELRHGGTNAEIAVRLGISPDTVKYHISNMLGKLGVDDRRQLAAWRPEAERRRLRALLAAPLGIGSMARPLAWVGTGAAVLVGVAAVAVGLVVLGDYDDQPVVVPPAATQARESPATLSPTPQPSPAPTPEASPSPEPNPVVTPQPTPIPASTPDPTATPDSRSLSDQPEPDPSRYEAFGPGPPETLTTVLQPGLNLAGWTESDAGVAAIFEAIPELRRVYAWEAAAQWFRWAARTDAGVVGDLTTLLPGMGLWLELGGSEPVSWTRRLIPQTGLADLQEGWNLIVWAGRDGIATTDALSHLEGVVTTALDADSREPATLTKGGAFWLKASTEKQWWQLDEPPRVEFLRHYSAAKREDLQTSLDDVVVYFARRFGLGVPGLTVRFGDESIKSSGAYTNRTVSLSPGCEFLCLPHEYAHAIQGGLGGFAGSNPAWIYEGVANRWSSQYDEATGDQLYAETRHGFVIRFARNADAPLQSMETYGEELSYQVGALAIDWLVARAGEDALIRYFARRSTYGNWHDVFHEAFGITAPDFYERFQDYRHESAPPFPRVSGVVLGPHGHPAEGITVLYRDRAVRELYTFIAWTDAEGEFEGAVGDGSYRLSLEFDDCPLKWSSTDSRLEPLTKDTARLEVDEDGLEGLVFVLSVPPSEQCQSIEGTVTDLAGNPRTGVALLAPPDVPTASMQIQGDMTGGRGTFAIKVSGGIRWLLVRTGVGDGYYGGGTGFTLERSRARLIDVKSSNHSRIVIPYGVIRGTVLGSDGQPVEGVAVYTPLHDPPGGRALLQTEPQGDFALAVPSGAHTLELECLGSGRGGWYGGEHGFTTLEREAASIVLETADVEGIVINVPFTQAAVDVQACPSKTFDVPLIKGVVLGQDGEPRRGLRVKLTNLDLSRIVSRERLGFTRAEGSFLLESWSAPDYLYLWLHPETSCISGLANDGEWIEIGRTGDEGRFTLAADLPRAISVHAPNAESIVIRVPPPCSVAPQTSTAATSSYSG